ncbi:unnamed protein product [Ostreobium quekettii]|uniref:Uncharacterized protein n=1 Tax=Ostreobium quekettii TaxID=121088 RepID=A0A8S1JD95_9CHLO|nr:unnamed protein product [Ostreobium quekettii]|eukprot:evm.model.scf_1461EXC.2 EVM.evm.TU.scf_1461EXC.2   scf_1461EXC:18826-19173(-)
MQHAVGRLQCWLHVTIPVSKICASHGTVHARQLLTVYMNVGMFQRSFKGKQNFVCSEQDHQYTRSISCFVLYGTGLSRAGTILCLAPSQHSCHCVSRSVQWPSSHAVVLHSHCVS